VKRWLFLLILGSVAVFGPIAGYLTVRFQQRGDLNSITPLRASLDSARTALITAHTPADSAQLIASIRLREEGLGQRDYHVSHRQARLEGWWELPGLSSLTLAAGIVLVILALTVRGRSRDGAV
jgi:hypothetical protein